MSVSILYSPLSLAINPIAIPAKCFFKGTPAAIKAIEEAQTEAIDVEPFEDKISETYSLLDEFLKTKGINDSKILIIDENNEEKEVDFYTLPKEEQLEILNSQKEVEQTSTPTQLAKDQDDFINYLKDNNLTLQEYLDKYKELVLSEVQGNQDSYSIDAYDDEEVFTENNINKTGLRMTSL